MVNHKENLNHALVLGGGGSLAIGWQLGYISALDQAGIDVRHSDLVIGTSGGAQAATGITSNKSWEDIFEEQIALKSNEEPPSQDMSGVFARYNEIEKNANTPKEWIENYSEYALEDNKFDENEHINRLKHRIKMDEWPQNLMITAVNAQKQSESHSHPNLKWIYIARWLQVAHYPVYGLLQQLMVRNILMVVAIRWKMQI